MAILGLASAGTPVIAQTQTSTTSTPSPAPARVLKAKPTKFTGLITAIDAISFTVANTAKTLAGQTLTIVIAPSTTFQKDGEMATLADFAVGDKATGDYKTDATGTMTAVSLRKK